MLGVFGKMIKKIDETTMKRISLPLDVNVYRDEQIISSQFATLKQKCCSRIMKDVLY